MHYYVLPGIGIYGGIKKAFHCAELLEASGVPCRVATPGAAAPDWFDYDARTVDREELPERIQREDTVLFSFPPDARFVRRLRAKRKIVHMQGANTEGDEALFSMPFEFISHGLHMTQQLLKHGRVAPYVPLGLRDVFRWDGETKRPRSVALMSRKGGALIREVERGLPRDASLTVIDGLSEAEVAQVLKETDTFVAISAKEAFGLPPLEAMAAGCAVLGYPGDGGFEFMRHGETAHVVPNGDRRALRRAVRTCLEDDMYRDRLREGGRTIAAYYTLERERAYLLRALGYDDPVQAAGA
ncbi:MAG: glycosyltransferase [Planctomycetota bacterium]|nr:glycosyltransferase [Planctomycetota bacterium]